MKVGNFISLCKKIILRYPWIYLLIIPISLILTLLTHQFLISRKWVELGDHKLYYLLLVTLTHIVNITLLFGIYTYEAHISSASLKWYGFRKMVWKIFIINTLGVILISYTIYLAKFQNTGEMLIPEITGGILSLITLPFQGFYFLVKCLNLSLQKIFRKNNITVYHILLLFVLFILSISCVIYPLYALGNFWGGGADFM